MAKGGSSESNRAKSTQHMQSPPETPGSHFRLMAFSSACKEVGCALPVQTRCLAPVGSRRLCTIHFSLTQAHAGRRRLLRRDGNINCASISNLVIIVHLVCLLVSYLPNLISRAIFPPV